MDKLQHKKILLLKINKWFINTAIGFGILGLILQNQIVINIGWTLIIAAIVCAIAYIALSYWMKKIMDKFE